MLKDALQKHDIEPTIELAPHFFEVSHALESHALKHGDNGDRLAAAAANEGVVAKRARAFFQIYHDGAPDAAPVPIMANVNRELGCLPVSASSAEYFKRPPANDAAVNLRNRNGMGR